MSWRHGFVCWLRTSGPFADSRNCIRTIPNPPEKRTKRYNCNTPVGSEWETRAITYMPGPTRRTVQYEGGVKSAYSPVLLRVMQCDPPHSPLSRFPHNTREVIRKLQRVDIHVSHVLHNTNQVSAMDNIFTFTGRIVGSSLMADVYSAQRAQARTGSHRARPVLGNK